MNEDAGLIHIRLDLLISLSDTTTGRVVDDRSARFFLNGREIRPVNRGNGNYIMLNTGRENGLMQIEVYGYEPYEVQLDYGKLDPGMPAVDVFLIPSEDVRRGEELLSFSGILSGLVSIEAVNPDRPVCGFREYDPKHRVMTIFLPNRRMHVLYPRYGLVNLKEGTFKTIEVEKELPNGRLLLKEPLEGEIAQNAPVCRILHGQVKAGGEFLFRVRDSGKNALYLLKYTLEDDAGAETSGFQKVDFHNLEGVRLGTSKKNHVDT